MTSLVGSPVTGASIEIVDNEGRRLTRRYQREQSGLSAQRRDQIDRAFLGRDPEVEMNFATYMALEGMLRPEEERTWRTTYHDPDVGHEVGEFGHQYLSINRLVRGLRGTRPSSAEVDYEASLDEAFSKRVNEQWIHYQASSLSEIRVIQQQGLGRVLSVLFGGPEEKRPPTDFLPTEPDHAYKLTRAFLQDQNIKVNFNRQSFMQRYQRERHYAEVVEHIKEVTERVDRALLPQRELERLVAEFYSGDKQLSLGRRGIEVRMGRKEIPLRALSSGERQLLFILLHVMAGGANSVIVDEPEISLHVDWQERLVGTMLTVNPACQLILATHSPDVMAHVDRRFIHRI
ncbi:hypothetical protein FHX71_002280 [Promicromonospora sukumoe]|uniref:ATPase AAA-type core domain-containing protein n=1 Tax=Promicromonospora sukumoe TaxID=88382 RepID=A0A7W3J8P4_9MICO|nr:hypothetical protein [Promicromonospora sukumoe]